MPRDDRSKHSKVVIIGRPNVGKSTLFNRLSGRRRAIVLDTAGVTRDRHEAEVTLEHPEGNRTVTLVDTGGLFHDLFGPEIQDQVAQALHNASLVLFVVDGREGLHPLDQDIARFLKRQAQCPVSIVINKIDHAGLEDQAGEFSRLGYLDFIEVSAEHARGISEIESLIWKTAQALETPAEDEHALPRICVVGRPNVGKSSLVNALLESRRMIVSPIAGTTVDSIETHVTLGKTECMLVDTAGVRRKNKTERGTEVLSVVATKKALEHSDLALIVLDAAQGLSDQDEKVAGLAEEAGCSMLIVVNKCDLMTETHEEFEAKIRNQMRFLHYVPIAYVSALTQRGLSSLAPWVEKLLKARKTQVSTSDLTECVRRENEVHNPDGARFYYAHQIGKHPPAFALLVNDPRKIKLSLERHLVNSIRKRWKFVGTPVRLSIRKSGKERHATK